MQARRAWAWHGPASLGKTRQDRSGAERRDHQRTWQVKAGVARYGEGLTIRDVAWQAWLVLVRHVTVWLDLGKAG